MNKIVVLINVLMDGKRIIAYDPTTNISNDVTDGIKEDIRDILDDLYRKENKKYEY